MLLLPFHRGHSEETFLCLPPAVTALDQLPRFILGADFLKGRTCDPQMRTKPKIPTAALRVDLSQQIAPSR
jgi:hypothetical protein